MPIKPGTIEGAVGAAVRPFSSLKLKMLYALNEARLGSGGFRVPHKITPEVIKKLNTSGVLSKTDSANFMKLLGDENTRLKTFGAVDQAHSKLAENILHSFVVRNAKPYTRNIDSKIHSLRQVKDPQILEAMKSVSDPVEKYLPNNIISGNMSASVVASALQNVGVKNPGNIVVTPGGSLFSKPSSMEGLTRNMYLSDPGITEPTHELLHLKDLSSSKIKKYAPVVGGALSAISLGASPVSILYGDEISKVIPGTVDDKIIKAFKYAGPEMYLAGQAIQHSPEFYAVKNTKDIIRKNPKYFESLSGMSGVPGDAKTLSDVQDVKARTYPSGILTNYGLLRLGTMPLHFMKQSSLQSSSIGFNDYKDLAKSLVMQRVNSIKGFFQGIKDPEIAKGILYHDSANKYKPVSSVIPAAIISAMVPSILLGEYFSHVKKPKPVIPAPAYSNDIKQGFGA